MIKIFMEEGVVDGEGGSSERCLKWGGGDINPIQARLFLSFKAPRGVFMLCLGKLNGVILNFDY